MDLSALLPSMIILSGLALQCTLSAVDDEDVPLTRNDGSDDPSSTESVQ